MKKSSYRLIIVLLSIFPFIGVNAQEGAFTAYSPYSVYGIGDIAREGTAITRGMGGIGTATRNKRYVNFMNPAAVTARDSLSFMVDVSVVENNKVYKQGYIKSANNTFNINDFVISFPIYRSSAMMFGISPYSEVGYDFSSIESNEDVIGKTGNISYNSYGQGGLYQVFGALGATFWKRFSIGAEMIYYFGNIDKTVNTVFSNSSYRSINGGYTLQLRGLTGKFGIQYEQRLGKNCSMILGATYRLATNVRGNTNDYSYAVMSEIVDTLRNNEIKLDKSAGLKFGDEIAVGIAFKGNDQWSAEFNYTRSDWSKSGFDGFNGLKVIGNGSQFSAKTSQSFRAGFEIVPNRNDIRYYHKRMTYRGGIYHEQTYYRLNGHMISASGITFGLTFPIFRLYNGLTVGLDLGQRGSLQNNLVRERYATISVGFNIHDIWFQKPRYN